MGCGVTDTDATANTWHRHTNSSDHQVSYLYGQFWLKNQIIMELTEWCILDKIKTQIARSQLKKNSKKQTNKQTKTLRAQMYNFG